MTARPPGTTVAPATGQATGPQVGAGRRPGGRTADPNEGLVGQRLRAWACDPYCPTCGTVTAGIPAGVGIAEFLEDGLCPECGKKPLRLTVDHAAPLLYPDASHVPDHSLNAGASMKRSDRVKAEVLARKLAVEAGQRITVGELTRMLSGYPKDAEVSFTCPACDEPLLFYRLKNRGPIGGFLIHVELNEIFEDDLAKMNAVAPADREP